MGCYRDDSKPRLLTGVKTHFSDNSPEKCLNVCLQSGFTLAGVHRGSQCFCGSQVMFHNQKVEDSRCDVLCSGDGQRSCGGADATQLYKTGIKCKRLDRMRQLNFEFFFEDMPKVTPTLSVENVEDKGHNIRIVFLLTLNGRSLRQITRLFKTIYRRKHYFYIHIDSVSLRLNGDATNSICSIASVSTTYTAN